MTQSVFNKQPILENELIRVIPLQNDDFEELYRAASDPLVWEQHPNKDRYQLDVFKNFFKGAIESEGAFIIIAKATGQVIGSSRYYDADIADSIAIGYTFISRAYWGKQYNAALKKLMIDHAFKNYSSVIFHIGSKNIRSQKAIQKLGAQKIGEQEMAYYGEPVKLNFVYQILKEEWN